MRIIFTILLLMLSENNSGYKTIAIIPVPGHKTILTDNLNNFYLLTQGTLTKYSPFGKKIVSFSDGSLGNITSADVTNPYHLILYYDNFNQILFLDDAMTISAEPVLLDNYKLFSVRAVSYAPDNGFFVFDEDSYTIKHFNESLKEDYESIPLYSYLKTHVDSIQLFFRTNRLFLFKPETGLLIFDEVGNFIALVSLPENPKVITIGQTALYYKDTEGKPVVFSLTTGQFMPFDVPENISFDAFVKTTNNTIIADKNKVMVLKKTKKR